MQNRVLVTGGAGFIGSWFVRRWLRDPSCLCVVLDKLTYASRFETLDGIAAADRLVCVRGDVCDGGRVERLLREHQIEAIVHLAAESHVDRSIDNPAPFVSTNIAGTYELLDASLRYWRGLPPARRRDFRFLHVSTDEVYGSVPSPALKREDDAYAPSSPYAASKAAADHLALAYHRTYELPVFVAHSVNNFGPFQFPEKLIPLMILQSLAGGRLPVYGDGLHERDWMHVSDFVDGLRLLLPAGALGESYHFATEHSRTNLEVVQAICDEVDRLEDRVAGTTAARIERVADRPGHDRRYGLDSAKARRLLDWRPRWPWLAAIRETVAWYREHPEWVERMMDRRLLERRLGIRTFEEPREAD